MFQTCQSSQGEKKHVREDNRKVESYIWTARILCMFHNYITTDENVTKYSKKTEIKLMYNDDINSWW
jgi:hypothetical protein